VGPEIFWLDRGNLYLAKLSLSSPANFKQALQYRCNPNDCFISLMQRRGGDFRNRIWPIIDSLLSLGTKTRYFELQGFSTFFIFWKFFSGAGFLAFLQHSPNIATLKFHEMFFDTECCRLMGNMGQSPFRLCLENCKLESPEALGDGMRQHGGPTQLIICSSTVVSGGFSI
jgi:hypothetical protein